MGSEALPVLLLAGAFVLLTVLLSASTSVDLAGPVRSWFWGRDARRMQRLRRFPPQLHRAYWSRREYDRDCRRLHDLGYRIRAEEAVEPFITLPGVPAFGRSTPRPRRRRVPSIYVDYAYAPEEASETAAPRA